MRNGEIQWGSRCDGVTKQVQGQKVERRSLKFEQKKSFNHRQKFSNGQNGGENGIQTKFASSSIFSANWTKLVLLFDSFADSGQKSKIKLLLCRMKVFVGARIPIPTPLPIYLIRTLMTMQLKELEDFQFRSALIWVQWIWAEEGHNCIPMRRIGQFRDFQNLECTICRNIY